MACATIHVVQISPNDWVVRQDSGRELGHYSSRDAAEIVGRKLARKHRADLMIHDRSGKVKTEGQGKGWFARLFGR